MAVPDGRPLRAEDFAAIEKEMEAIIKEDRPFSRYEMPVNEGMRPSIVDLHDNALVVL